MSGKSTWTLTGGLGLAVWLAPLLAHAWGFPDVLDDPLNTRPPILDTGPTLPGDEMPVSCLESQDIVQPLSLGQAADLALCHSSKIWAAWAAIKVQAGAVGEARAAYMPVLSGTVSQLHSRTTFPGSNIAGSNTQGHTVYGSLTWRLLDFGGRAANREAANRSLEAALASHEAAIQSTLAKVVQEYFDAMTAVATVKARATAERLAQSTLATTQAREHRGASANSDVLQASAALTKSTLARQRAQGDAAKAVAVLVQEMGLTPHTEVRLPDEEGSRTTETPALLEQWLADAQVNHPAIKAARAQWEAAQAKVTSARSEGLPSVDLAANYYQNGYPGQSLQPTQTHVGTIGVTLNVPLFEGFARTYKIRGAQAQVEESEAQLADTEHQVLAEVVKAHADAMTALGSLATTAELVDATQAALESSQRRYARGAADVLEILNAQSAVSDALLERVHSLADWQSARLRLLADTGALGTLRLKP